MRELTLNISPCPNDTFMFDALINGRIDTDGLDFQVCFADIEELNAMVIDGTPDVSKISYAVFPQISDKYAVIDSGSALGYGNGPLVVARRGSGFSLASLNAAARIAIPGEHTTANLLMNKIFPDVTNKTPMLFSEIAKAVSEGAFDAGVLIHEGRFTYENYGLELVADLGQEWEKATGVALPLGGIVVSRALGSDIGFRVEKCIANSIRYAMENREMSRTFIKTHAQELDDKVVDCHIDMFVNKFSTSLGSDGRRAVTELLGMGANDIFLM